MVSSKYSLADVIKMAIESDKVDNHTALPAEVISFDSTLGVCSALISINRVVDDTEFEFPVLEGIPVVFPASASAGFTFTLAKGDGVLLIFSERNLDKWKSFGAGFPPVDSRFFDISGAVAIPGLNHKLSPRVPPQADATEMRGKKVFIGDPLQILTPLPPAVGIDPGAGAGGGTAGVVGQLDLLGVVAALIDIVTGSTYGIPGTGGGGISASSVTALGSIKSDLDKLKV